MVAIPKTIKFAIFLAIFLWASAFVGIRAGLQEYTPEGLALLRYLIASLCMAIVYFRQAEKTRMPLFDALALLAIGAVGIGVYNLMLNYGELSVSSGMASFVVAQSPIFTAILALLFLGEKLTLYRVIGFTVSVLGVALITIGENGGFKWDTGLTYIVIAALAGAFFTTIQKPYLKKYNAIQTTTYVIWGGTLFLAAFTPQLQRDVMHASMHSTLMIVYLGIFPAALGYVAWSYVLSAIPASRAASFLYFMPFMATLIGWAYLSEVPMVLSMCGGMLAIFGVWLVNKSYAASKPIPATVVEEEPVSEIES